MAEITLNASGLTETENFDLLSTSVKLDEEQQREKDEIEISSAQPEPSRNTTTRPNTSSEGKSYHGVSSQQSTIRDNEHPRDSKFAKPKGERPRCKEVLTG